MAHSDNTEDYSEKRSSRRLHLDYMLRLEHPSGQELKSLSIDISLGGLKVACKDKPDDSWLGENVSLILADEKLPDEIFECKVNRLDNKLMALELERRAATRFGLAISKNMFRQTSAG